jgi:hypothetical protein
MESLLPLVPNIGNPRTPDEASFELHGITPGAYYLFPLFADRTGQAGVAGPRGLLPTTYYSTRIPVEVVDRDVTGLQGDIHRNPDLAVHVTMEGDPPSGQQRVILPRVQLRADEALGSLLTSGTLLNQQPGTDGSLVLPNVFPARYKIQVSIPPGYYLEDIRQGSASLYNDATLTVTGEEPPPLEITLAPGGGEIRGIVRDKQGHPTLGVVVAIPQASRRLNSMLYRPAVSSPTTGEFAITGIAPGEYKVFAWDSPTTSGAAQNAEFIANYESRGRPVTVTAGIKLGDVVVDLITVESH